MTINNKSERNYRGKCLGWPVTSYGGGSSLLTADAFPVVALLSRKYFCCSHATSGPPISCFSNPACCEELVQFIICTCILPFPI